MIRMPALCWKYNLKVDVDETQRNFKSLGFNAVFLEGQSRTNNELYPLNQIKISGGTLSPDVKIHIGPKVTEIFCYAENFSNIEYIERTLAVLDETKKELNLIVRFASDETNRFGNDTEIRVPSINMRDTQIYLQNKWQKTLDNIMQVGNEEMCKTLGDFMAGRTHDASLRIERVLVEFLQFYLGFIGLAREDNNPQAEEWEKWLKDSPGMIEFIKTHEKQLLSPSANEPFWVKG